SADPARRRIRRNQFGVPGLQRFEFPHQAVVFDIRQFGVIEHVIAVIRFIDALAQREDACRRVKQVFMAHRGISFGSTGGFSNIVRARASEFNGLPSSRLLAQDAADDNRGKTWRRRFGRRFPMRTRRMTMRATSWPRRGQSCMPATRKRSPTKSMSP